MTPKQDKFVKAYLLNGGNATKAAKSAGYKGGERTLQMVGHENLSKPIIMDELFKHKAKANKKFSISFEQKQKILVQNIKLAQGLGQISAATGAISELNKMDGHYAPTRQRLESTDGNPLTLFIQQLSGNTIEPKNN